MSTVCCLQSDEGLASAPGAGSSTSSAAPPAAAPSKSIGGGDLMSEITKKLHARKIQAEAEKNAQANVCAYELAVHERCCNTFQGLPEVSKPGVRQT